MNPRLFGAIVVVGTALGGCRTGILPSGDLGAPRDLAVADAARAIDQAPPVDQAAPADLAGLHPCCAQSGGFPDDPCCDPAGRDLSGCIPIACILIL